MSSITINGFTYTNYQGDADEIAVEIYANQDWVDSAGTPYVGGAPDAGEFYQKVACTRVGTNITVPPIVTQTTDDAQENAAVLITAVLRAGREILAWLLTDGVIYASLAPTTNWSAIRILQRGAIPPRGQRWLTEQDTIELIRSFLNALNVNLATDLVAGTVKLSKPASDPSNPIVVGANEASFLSALNSKYVEGYASFDAALAAIGNVTPTRLIVSSNVNITASPTITANISLVLVGGAKFNISAGQTLTIKNGRGFEAPPDQQVFAGAGSVAFDGSYPDTFYPEWWGALGDNATDDLAAFNAMLASMKQFALTSTYVGGRILLSAGKRYFLNGTLHIRRPVMMESPTDGEYNRQCTFLRFPANTMGVVTHGASTYDGVAPSFPYGAAQFSTLRGFKIVGSKGSTNTVLTTGGLTLTLTGGTFTEVYRNGDNSVPGGRLNIILSGMTVTIGAYDYVVDSTPAPEGFGVATNVITIEKPRTLMSTDGASFAQKANYDNWPTDGLWNGQSVTLYDNNGNSISRTINTITSGFFVTFVEGYPPAGTYEMRVNSLAAQAGVAARLNFYHGLDLRTQTKVHNVEVADFAGNGFNLDTAKYPTYALGTEPNVNNSLLDRTVAQGNAGSGYCFRGINTNNFLTNSINTENSGGYGIFENETFGANHLSFHNAFNYKGAFKMIGQSAVNQIIACYTEGGQPSGISGQATLVYGGNHAAGLDITGVNGAGLPVQMIPDSGISSEAGFHVARKQKVYSGNLNTKPWIFRIGVKNDPDILMGFGAAEEDNNINAGNTSTNPAIPSWYLGYNTYRAGWYFWGHATTGSYLGATTDPSVLLSGSEAAEGGGRWWLRKPFYVGRDDAGHARSLIQSNARGMVSDKNLEAPTVQINAGVAKPAASADYRGTLWLEAGGLGTPDKLQVCLKTGADTYQWVDIVTAP